MLRRSLCAKVLLALIFLITACRRTDIPPVASTPISVPGITSLTYVVQRGNVTKTLEFTGRISPLEEVPLYFKTGGYVERVLVRPGDRVKAGDLLAELDAESGLDGSQNQIALAELNLAVAQARLTQAKDANTYAIARAEMALMLAQEQLARTRARQATYTAATVRARVAKEQAEAQLAWAQTQYQQALARSWESQEVRDASALALQQVQGNLEIAQAQYNQAIADEQAYQHELKVQEIAVKQAELELGQLKKGIDPVLAIEVRRAQQVLEWLKEGSQIVAPVDGEVISLSIYPGRPVESFRTAIAIANSSTVEVSAGLSNGQLENMTEGQKATITLSPLVTS